MESAAAIVTKIPYLNAVAVRYAASPLARRMAHGAFWSLAGAVLSRALSLVSSILVARMLGKEGFGQLGMIQSTVGMFGVFAGFGLGLTATKYVAELRVNDPEKAGRVITLSLIFAAGSGALMTFLLLLFAPLVASRALAAPSIGEYLRIASPMLFFGAFAGAQTGALSGFEAFRTIARVNLVAGLLTFPCIVGGVYFAGVNGAVWGLVAASAMGGVLNHRALSLETKRAGICFPARNPFSEQEILWRFSLPAVLASLLVTPVNWAAAAILVNQPGGYAEMGIFNAANQWRGAILFLPGNLSAIVLPLLSNLQGANDKARYNKVLRYNILLNVGTASLAALGISLLSTKIMTSYGSGFASGKWTLVVLTASAALSTGASVIGQAIASKGWMWWGLTLNFMWGSVLIFSCLLFADKGSLGLATAHVIAYSVHLVMVLLFTIIVFWKKEEWRES
ncbi:oligosaccharide flippase family protein [Geobacter pelophilus]|uniref:Oligosaccharide flippase family protein n=1 Tax=Geoanaerobacter pelophilus TaxID=60036 RepID=A0AAW4L9F2_9BACT|nr:oligosaccharide flippase family protein [Geoanaerobacter pelophilus]MBT0666177.1 oligosaccharide flippase family protein [Geoanaerobacter pelophilus]